MNLELVFHILIAFGVLQAFLLCFILLTKRRNRSTTIFAIFLIIEGITLFERLIAETGLMKDLPHFLGISYPISFLKPPLLFFLTYSIVTPNFNLKKSHFSHLVPFLLMLLLNSPFYFLKATEKVEVVSSFINYVPTYASFNFWFFLSFFMYIGIYLFLSLKKLREYRNHIKNNAIANWFLNVLYLYSGFLLISLVHFGLRPTGKFEFSFINETSMLLMTFLIQSVAYQFLSKSMLLTATHDRFIDDVDRLKKVNAHIKDKLEKEKVYLEDTLSLTEFASSLGLSKKYTSKVINQSFGTSFKRLVNHYRVEEVKSLMDSQKGTDVLLIDLGLRSGFNNKVSFYRTFKEHTGKSPSKYYNELLVKKQKS